MTDEIREPTDTALNQPQAFPLEALRETRPGFCHDCEAPVQEGDRFCPSCSTFLPRPWVGRLASVKRRLAAACLDGIFKDGGIFGAFFWKAILPGSAGVIVSIMSAIYGITALILWTRGTTPAKRLLGMTVITEDGEPAGFWRMFARETIGKWISTIVFGMGYLTIPGDSERRGWHDKMCDTWVVHDDED